MKQLIACLAVGLAVSGCSQAPQTPVPPASTPEGFAWDGGAAPVETVRLARLSLIGRGGLGLLQVGPLVAFTTADIGSIRLTLLRDTGGTPGTGGPNYTAVASNIRNNTAQTPYSNTVSIGNLNIGATYVVRSEAFTGPDAGGEQIDTMVASDNTCAPFTAPGLQTVNGVRQIDTTPQVIALPLVLKNKVFAGLAEDSNGLAVTNGTIENNSAAETISP
jgi:hypothetical protein